MSCRADFGVTTMAESKNMLGVAWPPHPQLQQAGPNRTFQRRAGRGATRGAAGKEWPGAPKGLLRSQQARGLRLIGSHELGLGGQPCGRWAHTLLGQQRWHPTHHVVLGELEAPPVSGPRLVPIQRCRAGLEPFGERLSKFGGGTAAEIVPPRWGPVRIPGGLQPCLGPSRLLRGRHLGQWPGRLQVAGC